MATLNPARDLETRLGGAMAIDALRLARRIDAARKRNDPRAWAPIAADLDRSIARCVARRAAKPRVVLPPELAVAQRADDIAAAIRAHPVVIVCGETGSGKTTQLPKICLMAGRGERGLIGHTQPRRIAARAVAARIAQEMGSPLGEAVGFKVRFTDQTRPDAYVKLMTDGILLAETQRDRSLAAYDTIIVDEAHERSLNIDFLLGYLKGLVVQRPDLRVVITSATLDAERFARHFASGETPAPVIEVSGRMFPVEVRYRPLGTGGEEADDEEELEEAIVAAAEDLWREGPGDILVFLPGEREIRETGDLLRRGLARRPYAHALEVLPLYARLSVAEQQRIFAPSGGRRIVLATNVAETSLTVPGIRYVIDTGLARVKRYSLRNKTTLLQIEKVSRAAANQRAGRCGRVADGICLRLYDEADFAARPPYTDPEILRSSLAAVILRMAALDLAEPECFPFVDPPGPRAIADGYQLLQELDAVDPARKLTASGRELARLPLDPRIGRILQAARERGCLAEALVIASALAVPDPRERPLAHAQAADLAHQKFRDDRSDFLSLVALWEFFADALAAKLSHRRIVERCRAEFVSYLRLREWRDVREQLAFELAEAGWTLDAALPAAFDPPRYATIHKALLAGLSGNIGTKAEEGEPYQGARGIRFHLHPGSGLAKKPPRWVLAAELVETSRLYARCAARIEPEWIEEVAGSRVTRDYFEPHWDGRRGEVVASERVQLYGLTLVARRPVSFGAIDAAAARAVFIAEALVPGDLATRGAFLPHNRRLVAEIAELEHKARRQDVLVDDATIAAFYDERLAPDVCSLASFERWRSDAEKRAPRLLFVSREALMRHAASQVTEDLFPPTLAMAGATLRLEYRFAPGHPLDGLTLTVPLPLLNQLDDARLSWLVPGMVREKVTTYLKGLPKAWRGRLVPIAEVVTDFLTLAASCDGSLPAVLRGYLERRLRERVPAEIFDAIELPPHLAVNVRVVDAAGAELAAGRDLAALRTRLGEAAQLSFAATGSGPSIERKGLRAWDFGDLPETLTVERTDARRARAPPGAALRSPAQGAAAPWDSAAVLTGYPALVDDTTSVSIALFDTAEAATAATRAGVLRLMRFALKDAITSYEKGSPGFTQAALQLKTAIGTERLRADVLAAVVDRAFLGDDPPPRNETAFVAQVKRARTRLPAVAEGAFRLLAVIAAEYHGLTLRLAAVPPPQARFAAGLAAERDSLVHPGFFGATPWAQLVHLPRYLKALDRRLARHLERPDRDARHAAELAGFAMRHKERVERERAAGGAGSPALEAFRWLLEELKVSLFAQELRTPFPVSWKRIQKAWKDVES
ncbi:MAG: ATP-dependent RNA helicase HrpA [Betaproteobacteria bacterium]